MTRLRVSPRADAQMAAALVHTLETYGERKYREYQGLIQEALDAIAESPEARQLRPEVDPTARLYHIKKPGRKARHYFIYCITDDGLAVDVVAFVYDGMNLPEQWLKKR